MERIILIHGTEGSPQANWLPWLKQELEQTGKECLVPQFPTPEGQCLKSWLEVFDKEVGELQTEDILVGHSTGVIFSLNVLNKASNRIKAMALVAGFSSKIGIKKYDDLNSTFLEDELYWDKIRTGSKKILVYAGDDDPYVPLDRGQELANHLRTDLRVIQKGGHLNAEAGYTQFDNLLNDLNAI